MHISAKGSHPLGAHVALPEAPWGRETAGSAPYEMPLLSIAAGIVALDPFGQQRVAEMPDELYDAQSALD
jgi:hypothetical protein